MAQSRIMNNDDRFLVRITSKAVKYFVLLLLGFSMACLLSFGLGLPPVTQALFLVLTPWLTRIAILLLCLIATTIIIESLR